MKLDVIDYSLISQAQLFYKGLGYQNVESPWLVSQQAIIATLPPGAQLIQSNFGCLVGSGEQGFIQMMLDGTLVPGKFQTTTPCFRDEKNLDVFTRLSFFKTELIWYKPDDPAKAYDQLLKEATACMFEISDAEEMEAVQTSEGYDLMCNGMELGSYGVRQMGEHLWVYGTGIAEPRFSLVVQRRLTPQILAKRIADETEAAIRAGASYAAAAQAEAPTLVESDTPQA